MPSCLLPIDRIKTEDAAKSTIVLQVDPQQQQQQQTTTHIQLAHATSTSSSGIITPAATIVVTASAATAAAAASISGNNGNNGYDTPADNTVDTYDHTIKYMFSEDDGIQPEILEGDELLNEFLIRKKRDTSTSPTHSNGGSGAIGGSQVGASASGGVGVVGGHKGINDGQLIVAIRARKCLYEKGNANYKNIAEKEKMWKQVADECGADSVRVVRSRWKQLRDRFGREMKSAQPSKSGWKLFEEMAFIKDHVNVR